MTADPVRPDVVAEIVVVPCASAATSPLADTLATDDALLCHETDGAVAQFDELTAAVNCDVEPTRRVGVGGVTVTADTVHGGGEPVSPPQAITRIAPTADSASARTAGTDAIGASHRRVGKRRESRRRTPIASRRAATPARHP